MGARGRRTVGLGVPELVTGADSLLCNYRLACMQPKDFMTTAPLEPQRMELADKPLADNALAEDALADNALADACRALWLATLSLMAAFMQQRAPAHRYLLARRICANFDTLRAQDCFSVANRRAFARLALRWHAQAERLAPVPVASGALAAGLGRLFTPPH